MRKEIAVDATLLEILRSSGEEAAILGVSHTYTVLVPAYIWEECWKKAGLLDERFEYLEEHYRLEGVEVGDYDCVKFELQSGPLLPVQENLINLLMNGEFKHIVNVACNDDKANMSGTDCLKFSAN